MLTECICGREEKFREKEENMTRVLIAALGEDLCISTAVVRRPSYRVSFRHYGALDDAIVRLAQTAEP